MKTGIIDLYKYFNLKKPEKAQAILEIISHSDYEHAKNRIRPAMLVIAGGGYGHVSDREKDIIAFQYLAKGFNTFTLKYSVSPVSYPYQLLEGCMALAYIKENAKTLGVDLTKIAVIGFSAGGHLTGMLATMTGEKEVKEFLGNRAEGIKPSAVILSYPVITSFEYAHRGSIDNLSGGNKGLIEKLSLENRVNKDSSPAFIWGTVNDGLVPSENALLMAFAYKKNGVPFELHLFEDGQHGLSVATEETIHVNEPVQKWVELSLTWLKMRGFKITD